MKTTRLVIGVVSILIVVAFTASYAGEEKGYVPKEDEEIYGTWVNETMFQKKFILNPDGTWALYTEVSDTQSHHSATFVIEDKWTDSEGNIWYKTKFWMAPKESRLGSFPSCYRLYRISDSGKIMEFACAPKDHPDQIDPEAPTYRIYYSK